MVSLVNKEKTRGWERLDVARAVCLVLAVALICYLLYADDEVLPFSISLVWEKVSHAAQSLHLKLVTVGLLPVYVALMVFGGAFAGGFAGYAIRALFRRLKRLHRG